MKGSEDYKNKKIIFVFGGPGSGKGTQCEKIVKKYGLTHLSSGDLLREELQTESSRSKALKQLMQEGKLVPSDTVLDLILDKMKKVSSSTNGFLIDGYPRELPQALAFEKKVHSPDLLLNFDVSDETMTKRLLGRAATSGRADDNIETIKKRLEVFHKQTVPVLDHYSKLNKVVTIPSEGSIDEVFKLTAPNVEKALQQ